MGRDVAVRQCDREQHDPRNQADRGAGLQHNEPVPAVTPDQPGGQVSVGRLELRHPPSTARSASPARDRPIPCGQPAHLAAGGSVEVADHHDQDFRSVIRPTRWADDRGPEAYLPAAQDPSGGERPAGSRVWVSSAAGNRPADSTMPARTRRVTRARVSPPPTVGGGAHPGLPAAELRRTRGGVGW